MKSIDIARTFRQRVECFSCKKDGLMIIESRKSGTAIRRRKECVYCGNRETTYELSQKEYFEFKKSHALANKLKALIQASNIADKLCSQCVHMTKSGCVFDFPEAGGSFAAECSMYESRC